MNINFKKIPIEAAKRLFFYDEDGGFRYRERPSYKKRVGDKAGTPSINGYWLVSINGKQYMAHRVAWAIHYSEQPPAVMDHINGDKLDNRIENLRGATTSLNGANCGVRSHNKSGLKGASLCKSTGRWRADITINGKRKNLGRYATAEAAHNVWLAAARSAHGRFARAS